MKLLIPVAIFPPEIGGPATYVPELAKRLAEKGYEVHVATFGKPSYEERDGYFIHRVAYPKLPKFIAFPLRILKFSLMCSKIVREYDIDLIYAQEYISGLASIPVKKLRKKPIIYKFVGDWAWEYARARGLTKKFLHDFYAENNHGWRINFLKKAQKIALENAEKIIVPSKYLESVLEKIISENDKGKIIVIPNCIEIKSFDFSKEEAKTMLNLEEKTICCIGRLEKWKNFDLVIRAIAMMKRKEKIECKLLIIGDGNEKEALEELVKEQKINTIFLGKVEKETALNYIYASDFFILPSSYEGMSHVILEAMACKTLVLASDIPPNREIIKDGETGFLTEINAEEIKKKILQILSMSEEEKDRIRERAYDFVMKNNSWERHIRELERIFTKALKIL